MLGQCWRALGLELRSNSSAGRSPADNLAVSYFDTFGAQELCLAVFTAGAFAPLGPTALANDVTRLDGHGGPIHALAARDEGVLSASLDNSVGLWTLPAGAVRWLEGHAAAVKAVIALPGARAASAGDDFSVIVWDTAAGRVLHRLEGHRGSVAGLAVSPDGTRLASAGWDGRVGQGCNACSASRDRGAVDSGKHVSFAGSADGGCRA